MRHGVRPDDVGLHAHGHLERSAREQLVERPVLVTFIMAELCSAAAWLAGAATAPRVLVIPRARVNGNTLTNLFTRIWFYSPCLGWSYPATPTGRDQTWYLRSVCARGIAWS